jgi:hypothetical protein
MPLLADSLIKDQDLSRMTALVEFRHGARFTIRFVSRAALQAIAESCTVMAYSSNAKARSRTIDPEAFNDAIARAIVIGWSNITPEVLGKLMPLDLSKFEDTEAELPFTYEDLKTVLMNTPELDNFLQECAMDMSTFRKGKDAAVKN